MRYLVKARVKAGRARALLAAIKNRTLGRGSIAGDEYLVDMEQARQLPSGEVAWVETCYCPTPLEEERPYWEEYFQLTRVKNARNPAKCRDLNGTEPWACSACDCTGKLEERMASWGEEFLEELKREERQVRVHEQHEP